MKIKLIWTRKQKMLEAMSIIVLLGLIGYLVIQWPSIPEKLPTHYNGAGIADAWGSKNSAASPVWMCVMLYGGITLVQRYPSIWNVPVMVNEDNMEPVYSGMLTMLLLIKLEVILCNVYITVKTINTENLASWFLPVFLFTLFGTLIYSIAKVYRDAGNTNKVKKD